MRDLSDCYPDPNKLPCQITRGLLSNACSGLFTLLYLTPTRSSYQANPALFISSSIFFCGGGENWQPGHRNTCDRWWTIINNPTGAEHRKTSRQKQIKRTQHTDTLIRSLKLYYLPCNLLTEIQSYNIFNAWKWHSYSQKCSSRFMDVDK